MDIEGSDQPALNRSHSTVLFTCNIWLHYILYFTCNIWPLHTILHLQHLTTLHIILCLQYLTTLHTILHLQHLLYCIPYFTCNIRPLHTILHLQHLTTLHTILHCRPRWLILMRRPTGDQEVVDSTPAEVGNILLWRLIMKYFLRSFSPFGWFKKGSCQFLAKECAQYWLTA